MPPLQPHHVSPMNRTICRRALKNGPGEALTNGTRFHLATWSAFQAGGYTMAKKSKLLSDLFHDTLKDVYFAEKKILTTLPKMAKAAQSRELKAAFVKHERETRGQVKRLEQVFKIFGKKTQAKKCEAIMGITKEGAEIMTD
jgi:Domain of unknown function (DUF892)